MRRSVLEPLFIHTSAGPIFLLPRAPRDAKGCVLFVPSFGEEMNKCRRQVTETAEILNAAGFATIVPDLPGTGDSPGDFSDATWESWRESVVSTIAWSVERGLPTKAVVGIRLGCMLAADSLAHSGHTVQRTAFWQPVESGRQFMAQFLRLRVAASLMENDKWETGDELRTRLNGGDQLEVSGYALNARLFGAIEERSLISLLGTGLGRLSIYEIGLGLEARLSVPAERLVKAAIERGLDALGCRLAGEPFWGSTEIVTNEELAQRTAEFIAAGAP